MSIRTTSLGLRLLLISMALLAVGLIAGSGTVSGYLLGYLIDRVDDDLRPFADVATHVPVERVRGSVSGHVVKVRLTQARTSFCRRGNPTRAGDPRRADSGPGMSPEHASRIFERFYRASVTGF